MSTISPLQFAQTRWSFAVGASVPFGVDHFGSLDQIHAALTDDSDKLLRPPYNDPYPSARSPARRFSTEPSAGLQRGAAQYRLSGRAKFMEGTNEVLVILIALSIDDAQSLFVLLADDGTINRRGNGSVVIEGDMFVGRAPQGLFEQLRSRITPGVIHFLGQHLVVPKPKGKPCELTVMFKYADGREAASGWRYALESQGPHPEVCAFVAAAVELTEPWFQRQKAMVHRNASSS